MRIWKQLLLILVLAGLAVGGYEGYRTHFAPREEERSERKGSREIPVEVGQAERRILQRNVEAVGTTRARRSVEIVPLASGRVIEVAFRPGQHVGAGDVLLRLDDDIERANLAEAEALLVEQEQAVERGARLQLSNSIARATIEQITAAKAAADAAVDRARRRLADRVIRAPFAGVVGLSDVDVGARIDDDTVVTTLDDLNEVEIQFSLPETLFAEIASGQTISARSAAFPDRTFVGRVAHIDSRIDPVSRSFKARALVPNPDGLLPSGMFMSLTLTLSESEALVVPEEAIVVQAADTFVFVVEDGRAVRRAVTTGQRREGVVAVASGLEQGEVVVTRGLQRVRDGAAVKTIDDVAAGGGS
jgi:membrane fusion protein (multidrug efflux system)